ncbi:MAG: metal-dependent transcriptional regulator [Armatimonadetes bacterium]|nr:metal-dependent transcriptional regulator [Armatimonadota bacterium]MDE2206925.1 metal-dependent transcriptional regulator [Armatimonadota bacterium]
MTGGLNRELMLRVPPSCRPRHGEAERRELSEAIEEYTEGIYRLQEELAVVSNGDVARYMNVAPASVSPMLKKLAELGLAEHTRYHGVRLTARGETLSLQLLRKHRLLECLLVDFLELPWDDVHELACKLEHYISEDVADRIARALQYPEACPHGNPIDATAVDGSKRLADLPEHAAFRVTKVTDERQEFLAYLMEIGLIPGATGTVSRRAPFGDVITLQLDAGGATAALGRELAASIWALEGCELPRSPGVDETSLATARQTFESRQSIGRGAHVIE